jgi:hypothetical protein
MEMDADNTYKHREGTDYTITKKRLNTSLKKSGVLRRSSSIKARENTQGKAQQKSNCSKIKYQKSEKKKNKAKLPFDKTDPMTEEEALSIFQAINNEIQQMIEEALREKEVSERPATPVHMLVLARDINGSTF